MIELNSEKCHNFQAAEEKGRCPFTCICSSNCVFVWKYYYDSTTSNKILENKIDELEDRIDSLEDDVSSLRDERDDLQSSAENAEIKYNNFLNVLADIIDEESINKIRDSVSNTEFSNNEQIDELINTWEIKNACRTQRN